jgi:hypothetical protein
VIEGWIIPCALQQCEDLIIDGHFLPVSQKAGKLSAPTDGRFVQNVQKMANLRINRDATNINK